MKHSPNIRKRTYDTHVLNMCFLSKQNEIIMTQQSKEDVKPSALTTWLILITILIGISSCTKEVSKPIQLRPPVRPNPVTVTARFYVQNNTVNVEVSTSKPMTNNTGFAIQWAEVGKEYAVTVYVDKGKTQAKHDTNLSNADRTNVRLIAVIGGTETYTLKIIQ